MLARPGLIVGPYDPTGRFTYWPHRVARGGELLAPGPTAACSSSMSATSESGSSPCSRDLEGTFNLTHPGYTWGEVIEACGAETGSNAEVTWVDDGFLLEQGVGEWMELPLWIADPDWIGTHLADVSRALAEGLDFRPLRETVRDTLALAETTDAAGLAPARSRVALGLRTHDFLKRSGNRRSRSRDADAGAQD